MPQGMQQRKAYRTHLVTKHNILLQFVHKVVLYKLLLREME